mmetsp:Transcript_115108/g.159700  ORF Transcript_115108/g.159700 Transcript_115108/m.159700 type:complete len:83 (-) Transcript_115108:574-822(-)
MRSCVIGSNLARWHMTVPPMAALILMGDWRPIKRCSAPFWKLILPHAEVTLCIAHPQDREFAPGIRFGVFGWRFPHYSMRPS